MSLIQPTDAAVAAVFDRVEAHDFHPVDADSFTIDRRLGRHGIADLDDPDWRVRLLAVRDLVRTGQDGAAAIGRGLRRDDVQVRYLAATALGILRAGEAAGELERVLRSDSDALARSPAAVALGEMEAGEARTQLQASREQDPSWEVRHQAQLALEQIERGAGATEASRRAWVDLDPDAFGRVRAGDPAPDFALASVDGTTWRLAEAGAGGWTVLVWIFAHWCPVCHGEFRELIELGEAFAAQGVTVATIECHDAFRARVMTGREIEPDYWFAEESFRDLYTRGIWWPHLMDPAGRVGAMYGVDPLAHAVHAEYINRPSTIIIDPDGRVRLAYFGTFWGDRPSMEQTLDMVRSRRFDFRHPERLRP